MARWAFLPVMSALVMAVPSLSQGPTVGIIAGRILGPGGIAVPGATVQALEPQTGHRKIAWSNRSGRYTITGLHPGVYSLQVSLVGFRTETQRSVKVAAGNPTTVNFTLMMSLPGEVGPPRARPLGESAGRRMPLGRGQGMQGMPGGGGFEVTGGQIGEGDSSLRFSNDSEVSGLQSGGSIAEQGDQTMSSLQGEEVSAANSFLLSGSPGRALTPESREEQMRRRFEMFRQARAAGGGGPGFGGPFGGPGFGRGWLGGRFRHRPQINRIRGNIIEQYGNSALDSRAYPLTVPESRRIAYYHQQLGVSIGGPLVIPKIYNGSNKTSFFLHYNLQRSKNPFDSFSSVPTAAERAGDFSQAVIPTGSLAGTIPTIYDPQSGAQGSRVPFPGNVIPASQFAPAAMGLLRFIPLPNLPGSVQNFHLQESLPSDNDRFMGRVGQRFSDRDNLSVFYFFNSSRSVSVSSFPELTSNASVRGQSLNLSEIHTFNPHAVNTLSFRFIRQRNSTLNPFAYQEDVAGQLGIQGISQNPRDWGVPIISFTNFASLNDTIPSLTRNQTYSVSDSFLWNMNKHNVRIGGGLRRVDVNTLTDPDARGTFTFTGFGTSEFASHGFPIPGTGYDFADFLLGLPQVTSVRFGVGSNYLRSWVYAAFAQDDWRVSSRLTLNIGLRYEYFQPFDEKYGHLADLMVGPNFSTVDVVTGLSRGPLPSSLIRGDKNNFAPRVGLAYRPWTDHSLVLRAGYGIFYDGSIYQRLVPNLVDQPPFAEASILTTSPQQVLTLENGFPQIAPDIARNTYAVDPNFRTPYGQTWNFTLEDRIVKNMVLSVGYTGTKGSKLDLLLGPNRAVSLSPTNTQENLAIQNALQFTYETAGASSIYHGLQVGLRREYHGGLSVGGYYTFSKSIDDAASVGGAGHLVAQDYLDLQAERGLSVFDVRHRLTIFHIYRLPFGERGRYLNQGGVLARLFGNWQWSGNTTLQSGAPFTARVLGNQSNNAGTGAYLSGRADASGQPVRLSGSEQTTLQYFNTAAFMLPPPGQFGNAGRNTIPGPRTINFNMGLSRFVTISREKKVRGEIRISANNVFNTPSFSGLATVINAQDFGRVTSVKPMRTLNFSFRVRF